MEGEAFAPGIGALGMAMGVGQITARGGITSMEATPPHVRM
jgi:hypothetical protein